MRPTTSTMLQQNNNNNYPCLTMSGTTRDMLQKCSRAALPFPSRMELGDLPLIRGLRAWALCSRNRRKAGGLLGGGQSPTAPPAGHRKSTSCPKPADVYLSGEWGRMGYGLPLGLDARQAEIGALVTVATLKTSEGSGKTQTQCLFLRTEKGSCLYSTAKPGPGVATGAACSVVGGWLRGKTGGGGGRDTPAGRRDSGPSPLAQTGANRVRVRSGRRWRKSSNAAGREKTVVSRERQHRSREDPVGEIILEERKEVQEKGALGSKQFPSLQQDSKKGQQETEGACRTPKCSHNASPKTCTQCGKRAQRRESQEGQEGHEGGESPSSEMKGMRKQKQNVEEGEGGSSCELGSTNFLLAVPACDLESSSFHPESLSGCNVEEIREAESNKEQDSHGKEKENHCEEVNVNGLPSPVEANQKCEKASMDSADVEVEERSISQTPTESPAVSNLHQDVSVSTCPAFISSACCPESSPPVEGSSCAVPWVQRELRSHQDEQQHGEEDTGIVGNEELDVSRFEPQELNFVANENNAVTLNKNRNFKNEKNKASSSPFRHPSTSVTGGMIIIENSGGCRTTESERRDKLVSEEDDTDERINPDGGVEAGGNKLDGGKGDNKKEQHTKDVINASTKLENNYKIERNCSPKDDWNLQESADGCSKQEKDDGDACGQISTAHIETRAKSSTNVACADPPLANPAPSLPPLGSMATGLPHLVAEEEEEDWVRVTARDGEKGQEGKRRHRDEVGEHGEGERGSTVATGEERKEEEEEEDEFGVFMQAEGEPACSEGFTVSPSVPCGSRANVALGNHAIAGESIRWMPGWTESPVHQSGDAWTAFPQDLSDGGREAVEQWWPSSAVEERRLSASHSLVSVFAEAFPSLPGSSLNDPCDLDTVPTLTQLLRCRASRDQGLLDSFHDLNKMIGQRYKRASGVSRDLLLKTLHLEQPQTESRPAPWTVSRRLSPGLPSANQRTQNAAAKRRLSYDYNRNIMD